MSLARHSSPQPVSSVRVTTSLTGDVRPAESNVRQGPAACRFDVLTLCILKGLTEPVDRLGGGGGGGGGKIPNEK